MGSAFGVAYTSGVIRKRRPSTGEKKSVWRKCSRGGGVMESPVERAQDCSVGKESRCGAGDPSSIPGSGRSPGEGKDYPLQCSGLENSMDCIVHGVAKSQTCLSNFQLQDLKGGKV